MVGLLSNILACLFLINNLVLFHQVQSTDLATDADGLPEARLLCNKTWFMKNYFDKGKYINLDNLKKKCNQSHFDTCNGLFSNVSSSLREDRINDTVYFVLNLLNIRKNESCWGYAVEMSSQENKVVKYYTVQNMKSRVEFHYSLKTKYTFRVLALPSGRVSSMNIMTPGRCELEIVTDIYRKMKGQGLYKKCIKELKYDKQLKFASKQCRDNKNPDVRRELLKKQMDFENCNLVLREPPSSYSQKVAIPLTVSALLVFIIIILLVWFSKKKKSKRDFLLDSYSKKGSYEERDHMSVMLIHRPGCELLESLVLDLRTLLISYGIEVKATLLEQELLNREGGIPSYLQRNINMCDYILIFITENENDGNHSHHPYKYVLKMLEGLSMNKKNSTYIPLYLKPYCDAVYLFPTFLQSSMSYGYQLPKESLQLVFKLLSTKIENSKERDVKNKLILRRMKETVKMYSTEFHFNCSKSNCSKGMNYPSTGNLSSVWASTVNDRRPSFDSIQSLGILDNISEGEFDMEKNNYNKTLNYVESINISENNGNSIADKRLYLESQLHHDHAENDYEMEHLQPPSYSTTSSIATEMTDCTKYCSQTSQTSVGTILCNNQHSSYVSTSNASL